MLKWLRKMFHGPGLQARLILTFFPLLALILGVLLAYVNGFVLGPLKEKTVSETLLTATKLSSQLDDYIGLQDQLSQRVLSNQTTFDTLSAGSSLDPLTRVRRLKDIMFQALGPSLDVRDMAIYDLEGNAAAAYIGLNQPRSLRPVIENAAYADKLTNSSYILYAEPSDEPAFIRTINDKDGKIFGYLYIALDPAYLQKVADGAVGANVYVVDSEGNLIVKSNGAPGDIGASLLKRTVQDRGLFTATRQYIAYQNSASSGWTTVVVTNKAAVLGSVNSVKNVSIVLIVSLALFSLLYVYFSARNFVLPIRRLRSQIMRMNYSNLNLQTDSRLQNNDLQLLNEAFGELLDRLQTSIEREKLAVHEEVMARNTALQAQIGPHFLHNTLYLISIAAQEGKNEAVSEMCRLLSESLRYIVSSPYQHASMKEEIEHARRYLALVQRNYEDDLTWEIVTDPAADTIELPRLVIQPFVENCIEHAFENADPPWHIRIENRLFNGMWAIEISDNGQGIDREKIREILRRIEQSDHGVQELKRSSLGIGNMGIINTVNRLKLMYKNRLIFNVFNNAESGTTIQIIASLHKDFY